MFAQFGKAGIDFGVVTFPERRPGKLGPHPHIGIDEVYDLSLFHGGKLAEPSWKSNSRCLPKRMYRFK